MVTSIEEGVPTAAVTSFAEKNGAFEGKLDVLRNADTVMCIGANFNRSHMVVGFMFKRNLPKGTRLINIDPEASELDYLANISLKNKPGSDLALIKGLQAIIVKEGLGRSPLSIPKRRRAHQTGCQSHRHLTRRTHPNGADTGAFHFTGHPVRQGHHRPTR